MAAEATGAALLAMADFMGDAAAGGAAEPGEAAGVKAGIKKLVWDASHSWLSTLDKSAELVQHVQRGAFGSCHLPGEKPLSPTTLARPSWQPKNGAQPAVSIAESYVDMHFDLGDGTFMCLVHGCASPLRKMSSSGGTVRFDNMLKHFRDQHPALIDTRDLASVQALAAAKPIVKATQGGARMQQQSLLQVLAAREKVPPVDAVLRLLIKRPDLSFSFVTSDAMRSFLSDMGIADVQLPSRRTLVRHLDVVYREELGRMMDYAQKLSKEDLLGGFVEQPGCGTMDTWTSRSRSPFCAFTWTIVGKDFKFVNLLLALKPHPHPHTAESYYRLFKRVSEEWRIKHFMIVTDSASNMIKSFASFFATDKILRLPCMCHKLNTFWTHSKMRRIAAAPAATGAGADERAPRETAAAGWAAAADEEVDAVPGLLPVPAAGGAGKRRAVTRRTVSKLTVSGTAFAQLRVFLAATVAGSSRLQYFHMCVGFKSREGKGCPANPPLPLAGSATNSSRRGGRG